MVKHLANTRARGVYHDRPIRKGERAVGTIAVVVVARGNRRLYLIDIAACLQLIEDIKHDDNAASILAKCEEVARLHYPDLL